MSARPRSSAASANRAPPRARPQTPPRAPRRAHAVVVGASALAVLFVGGVIVRALTSRPPQIPEGTGAEVRDILDLGGDRGVAAAGGLMLQLTDRADPTRLAMELRAARMDPIARETYRVSDLKAWIFRSDGTRLWVRADAGTLILPDRSREPDSGSLTGDVVIRRFRDPAPGVQIDPERDAPEFTVRTPSLTFDQLGEVSTEDRIVVTTADGELAGSGLRILVNESRESLMLLRLARGEYLRIRAREGAAPQQPQPMSRAGAAPSTASPSSGSPSPARQPSTLAADAASHDADEPSPPGAVETRYLATFDSDVVLRDGPRTVAGDRLEVWARLFDNALRPGAVGGADDPAPATGTTNLSTPNSSTPSPARPDPSAAPALAGDARAPEAPNDTRAASTSSDSTGGAPDDLGANGSQAMELTWAGVLEIRPLSDEPPELADNDVTARVTAERSGLVRLADASTGATGSASTAEYRATTRDLWLSAPGAEGVRLEAPDRGVARFGRLELNLATGIGHVPGPGIVESASAGRVEWREQADLVFRVADGAMTADLAEAMCAGGARASRDAASIESQFLRAIFNPGTDESELRRLIASERVRLADGRGGEGRAEHLDIMFAPGVEGDPRPTEMLARGEARFSNGPDFVQGGVVHATITLDDQGELTASHMRAIDDAWLERRQDGVVVRGREVVLDAEAQTVDATGPDAVVQRLGARISGDFVRLDGRAGTARVIGRGAFQHRALAPDGFVSTFDASWSRGMSFDDATGLLLCDGDVSATHQPDALTRDAVLADAVRAELTAPPAPTIPQADGLALAPVEAPQRELRRFVAIAGEGGPLAVVEASRAVADESAPSGQRLARALRLKGLEIIADQQAGLIEVPSRGELLAADLRADADGQEDDRGSALFTWATSMRFSRASGRATMEGGTSMVHRRLDGGTTVIECGSLAADIATDEAIGSADEAASASLRRVWAIGSVYARSGDREMVADEAIYDPVGGRAEAFASAGRRVTVLDSRTGSPLRAQRVFWDLRTDRVEVNSPSRLDGLR